MSEREQYGKLADELEDHANTLAGESDGLGGRIAAARDDWERTRAETGAGTPDWDDPDEDEDNDDDDNGEHDSDDEGDENDD